MQWIATLILAVVLIAVLPWAIVASNKSMKRNGRFAGAALAIGSVFAWIADPPKTTPTEEVHKKQQGGDAESGQSELTD